MCQTRRRQFLFRCSALALLAGARAEAQPRTHRMAFLFGASAADASQLRKALFDRLAEIGYKEGQNLALEQRYAEGRLERLPALAAELVTLKPDVIFAVGTQAALACAKATSAIPIVFILVADPIASGLVKSLRRPGGNVTGVSAQIAEIQGKRLQLLKDALPSVSRVAVLHDPHNPAELPLLSALKNAATTLDLKLRIVEARSSDEFASAFRTLAVERHDALYVFESPSAFSHRARIVELANVQRLPSIYGGPEFVEAGGLLSYSMSGIEHVRSAATYIEKILKGANPAELPVEQPTRFELVLNLRTAKLLGLRFPPSISTRADRVIE